MNKSATLITTALLTFGLAAASMAADAPNAGTPAAAADGSTPTPSAKAHRPSKKHKKVMPAPSANK